MARGTCPTGCGRNVGVGKLMCSTCWAEVPEHLRAEVYRTWSRYRKLVDPDLSEERRAARVAYQEARDAALGSIA